MVAISILILFIYFVILLWLVVGSYLLNRFRGKKTDAPMAFTIVIPFRDESENLKALCDSLSRMVYPNEDFEVLFIDDESGDDSVEVIHAAMSGSDCRYRILNNVRRSASPKKDAITLAVEHCETPWTVTTDADCEIPEHWLLSYNSFIQQYDPYMVCGPVQLNSSWGGIQSVENLGLQGVGMGGFGWRTPLLCNGANLGFRTEIFKALGGYSENDHIASGDDVFLMEKLRKVHPAKLKFLKDDRAIVTTRPVRGLSQVVRQRVRWAKKTAASRNPLLKVIGALIFLINLWMVVLVITALFKNEYLLPVVLVLAIKIILENIYIQEINSFFRKKLFYPIIIIHGLLYPFVSVVVVVLSRISGYRWKGRYHER